MAKPQQITITNLNSNTMKKVTIQANKVKGQDTYKLSVSTNETIESAIFVEITGEDIEELQLMLNQNTED